MTTELIRRDLIVGGAAMVVGSLAGFAHADPSHVFAQDRTAPGSIQNYPWDKFLFGLNTSTIRGQKLSIVEEVALAAKAGYQGMELLDLMTDGTLSSGGSLEDLGKRFQDAGIRVEKHATGFFDWINDDPSASAGRVWKLLGGAWTWFAGSAASVWPHHRWARPISR